MSDTITLGINIFGGVLILFGVLWGIIRGLKKTTSRLVFLLITSIVLIFVTIPIVNAILRINVNMTIDTDGVITTEKMSILEAIIRLTENMLGVEFVSSSSEVAYIIVSLAIALINAFVYVILFWLLKVILFPINALLTKLILPDKKRKNKDDLDIELTEADNTSFLSKKEKKKYLKQEKKKIKKYRWFGGAVGVLVGLVTTFSTMVPFYGVMNMASKYNKLTITNLTDEPTSIASITDNMSTEIVKGYELSVVGRLSKALGLQKLGLKTFDHLTTAKVADTKITLRKDVDALANTLIQTDDLIGIYKNATTNGLNNISQEDLTCLLNETEKLIVSLETSEFVNSLSPYILPIANDIIVEHDIKLTENEHVNKLILESLTDLAESNEIKIFDDLKSVINVAKYLDSQKLLIHMVTSNYENILTTIKNLEDNFANNLTEKLYATKIIDKTIPNVIEIGFNFFDEAVNFGYTENSATADEIKVSISTLLNDVITSAKTLSEESSIYITDQTLIKLGTLLDNLKTSKLYNTDTYNNLVDYALTQVRNKLATSIPDNFSNFFHNQFMSNVEDMLVISNNSSNVASWQEEMSTIYEAIQILRNNDSGIIGDKVEVLPASEEPDPVLRDGYSINFELTEDVLINLGKALDKLEETKLFGSPTTVQIDNTHHYECTTLVSLFTSVLTELKDQMSTDEDSITNSLLTVIDSMKHNLAKDRPSIENNPTFWKNELTTLSPTIIYLKDMSEEESPELTDDLAVHLDNCAHNSIMLGGDATLKLMTNLIDIVEDEVLPEDYIKPEDITLADQDNLNDNIYLLLGSIKTNLTSEETLITLHNTPNFWQNEIDCILSLTTVANESSNIEEISDASTIASDIDNVYNSKIVSPIALNRVIATVLKDTKTEGATGVQLEINKLIDQIAEDITNEDKFNSFNKTNFWQNETAHISELDAIDFDTDIVDNLDNIGEKLDRITASSQLITKNRVRAVLASAIDENNKTISENFADSGKIGVAISKALTDIKNNIADTSIELKSFTTELTHLQNMANLEIVDASYFKFTDEQNLTKLENNLATLGQTLDRISYNTITSENVTSYNEEINSKIITRPILASIISAAFENAKVVEPTKATDIAFNGLVSDIQDSIKNITNPQGQNAKEKVITWTRELSYVSTLIKLNKGTEYSLENVKNEIAGNLDKIAFNQINNDADDNYDVFADIEYNEDNHIVGNYLTQIVNGDVTYYNSVIIQRSHIKEMMATILDEIKNESATTDQEKITNDLIENLKSKINIGNILDEGENNIYNSYTRAFSELNNVKETMENKADDLTELELKDLSEKIMSDIDTMLHELQLKPISGVTTTKRIALLILDKIETILESHGDISETDTNSYVVRLREHFSANDSTPVYLTSSPDYSQDTLDNPMKRLFKIMYAEIISKI